MLLKCNRYISAFISAPSSRHSSHECGDILIMCSVPEWVIVCIKPDESDETIT